MVVLSPPANPTSTPIAIPGEGTGAGATPSPTIG